MADLQTRVKQFRSRVREEAEGYRDAGRALRNVVSVQERQGNDQTPEEAVERTHRPAYPDGRWESSK